MRIMKARKKLSHQVLVAEVSLSVDIRNYQQYIDHDPAAFQYNVHVRMCTCIYNICTYIHDTYSHDLNKWYIYIRTCIWANVLHVHIHVHVNVHACVWTSGFANI